MGVAGGLCLVGSFVWAGAATFANLWPGPTYKAMQAVWLDGEHGLLTTFAASWLTLFIPLMVLGVLVTGFSRGDAVPIPDFVEVPRYRRKRLAWGLGLAGSWGASAWACFVRPEALASLGQGAVIALLWALLGLPIMLYVLIDGVLPPRAIRGPIERLGPPEDPDEDEAWTLEVREEIFHLAPEDAARLREARQVMVVSTAMGGFLMAAPADAHPYRR